MIHILGGGTFNHVRSHLALAAPAFGETAREFSQLFLDRHNCSTTLHLTKMADHNSDIVTNDDAAELIKDLIENPKTKVIIQNFALCDFNGSIGDVPSGKHALRLKTKDGLQHMDLEPADKLIGSIKQARPDIFVVGFKTTADATVLDQAFAGKNLLQTNGLDLVIANDIVQRRNIVITPEYESMVDRRNALAFVVDSIWEHLKK